MRFIADGASCWYRFRHITARATNRREISLTAGVILTTMAPRYAILLLPFFAPAAQAPQASRSAHPTTATSSDWRPSRRVIVTIGIDRCRAWPTLSNAVSDATEVTHVFRAAGFEEVVPPLLNGAADRQSIQ